MRDLLEACKVTMKLAFRNWQVNYFLKKETGPKVREIAEFGYSHRIGLLSINECQIIQSAIDELIDNDNYSWCDYLKSDYRIYEAENKINLSWLDDRLADANKIATKFHSQEYVYTDLIARVRYTEGNLGSGGGWHRDSLLPQFKTIIYLCDAKKSNGAFEIIPLSHKTRNTIVLNATTDHQAKDRRFADDFIVSTFDDILTLEGAAGDQLFVNTNSIHRGRPLQSGQRYALTRYYFNNVADKQRFLDCLQR